MRCYLRAVITARNMPDENVIVACDIAMRELLLRCHCFAMLPSVYAMLIYAADISPPLNIRHLFHAADTPVARRMFSADDAFAATLLR